MEKYIGVVILINNQSNSKSDGIKAYLIGNDVKILNLYQQGVLDINDSYFYPFHKKMVQITGVLEKGKWLRVSEIEEIGDLVEQEISKQNKNNTIN